MLSSLAKRYNWSQTLDSIRKELRSWRTLKKNFTKSRFYTKNLDLVKLFLLTKNFTKSGLYVLKVKSWFAYRDRIILFDLRGIQFLSEGRIQVVTISDVNH